MGGDDSVGPAPVQFREDSLRDGASGRGLRARSELIYKYERARVRIREHLLHVREERGISREVVLKGLVVPDADRNALEHRHFRTFGGGDQHAPLEHVLQQAHGFEADGFAACVGAGNQQDVLLGIQDYGLRHYAAAFFFQGLFQQGMAGLPQVQHPVVRYHGHAGPQVQGGARLGHQEIYLSDKSCAAHELRHVWTEELSKFQQDALDLASLGKAQFRNLVLQLYQLGRLYEGGLAAGGLSVNEAVHLAFGGCGHGNQVLPFAHGDSGVGIRQPGSLCLRKDGGGLLGDGSLLVPEGFAYVKQGIRSGILHVPVLVQDLLYAALHFGEDAHAAGQALQVGVNAVLDAGEKVHDAAGGVQQGLELPEAEHVYARPFLPQGLQEVDCVDVSGGGEPLLEHQHQAHLVCEQ